ncbi:F-box protein: endocytic membrane traffic, recycling ReCYcling 1 [Dimargaris verticillata]|uniref:F-box protein: endocytic membrane traffic, recycling ReCYcling 1 n=1 Tax=Dimargaris verticillata TaxID=2761393 RepID=A0A9W8B3V4_9FUNG|nr:F-box protein: endocytic membrane traffic, recycling ReCYcling 1 [Dimargaris verticillata]
MSTLRGPEPTAVVADGRVSPPPAGNAAPKTPATSPSTRVRRGIQPYAKQVSPHPARKNTFTRSLTTAIQKASSPLSPIATVITRLPLPFRSKQASRACAGDTADGLTRSLPENDLYAHTPLAMLPDSVLLRILGYLSVCDAIRVCTTCRHLAPLAYDHRLYLQWLLRMGCYLYYDHELLYADQLPGPSGRKRMMRRKRCLVRQFTANDCARDTDDNLSLLHQLDMPDSLIRLLQRLFQWPDRGMASTELRAHYEVIDEADTMLPKKPRPLKVVDLVKTFLYQNPPLVFQTLYTHLHPYYVVYRQPDGLFRQYQQEHTTWTGHGANGVWQCADTSVLQVVDMEQALLLDQLVWFSGGEFVNDAAGLNRRLLAQQMNFEAYHLSQFARAYRDANIDTAQYHASVLHLVRGGQNCLQFLTDSHPLFSLTDTGHPGYHTILTNALATVSHTTWPQFLKQLLAHQRDYSEVVAALLPMGRAATSYFAEQLFVCVIIPVANHVLEDAVPTRTLGQMLELRADMFCQCLEWIESIDDLPSVGLLVEHTQGVLFRLFESHVRRHLKDEKRHMDAQYQQMVSSWDQTHRFTLTQSTPSRLQTPGLASRPNPTDRYQTRHTVLKALGTHLGLTSKASTGRRRAPSTDSATLISQSNHRTPVDTGRSRFDQTKVPVSLDQEFHNLLSLDLALGMIHENKRAVSRVATFWADASDDWACKTEVYECIEALFALLVRHLGQRHIRPAFDRAIVELHRIEPLDFQRTGVYTYSLDALHQFLELIHLADLIVQMIEVYYKQEMAVFVKEDDFLSVCNQEKKTLEAKVDDQAAAGLDRVIDVMMAQVEHILRNTQKLNDFNPPTGAAADLQPTRACQAVLDCLTKYTALVIQATDKHITDVFLGEVGLRFFNIFGQHLRRFRVDPGRGGFQLISDLNAYHRWASTYLKSPEVMRYFDVLKELGHLYIITPQHLRDLLHDARRFEPILRVEEIYEFVILRTDYAKIKNMVEERCDFM